MGLNPIVGVVCSVTVTITAPRGNPRGPRVTSGRGTQSACRPLKRAAPRFPHRRMRAEPRLRDAPPVSVPLPPPRPAPLAPASCSPSCRSPCRFPAGVALRLAAFGAPPGSPGAGQVSLPGKSSLVHVRSLSLPPARSRSRLLSRPPGRALQPSSVLDPQLPAESRCSVNDRRVTLRERGQVPRHRGRS